MSSAESRKLETRLLNHISKASREWGMVEPNDRIMVCLSGGKDSWVLLDMLRRLHRLVPFTFSIVCVNLDQGHPGFPQHVISDWLDAEGIEYRMLSVNTYKVVLEKVPAGKTYCSLCSRLRRGILYDAAVDLGATKMALGHHRDDLVETAMLNLLYGGKLGTMPPKLRSDDGRNIIIRPLAYCSESDVAKWAQEMNFPIVPCNLCGSQEGMHRQKIKHLLADLEKSNPRVKGTMLAALGNVTPSHLLDRNLHRRLGIDLAQAPDPFLDGDVVPSDPALA